MHDESAAAAVTDHGGSRPVLRILAASGLVVGGLLLVAGASATDTGGFALTTAGYITVGVSLILAGVGLANSARLGATLLIVSGLLLTLLGLGFAVHAVRLLVVLFPAFSLFLILAAATIAAAHKVRGATKWVLIVPSLLSAWAMVLILQPLASAATVSLSAALLGWGIALVGVVYGIEGAILISSSRQRRASETAD